jgi:tetratricopeptide (TPR) repeat protein
MHSWRRRRVAGVISTCCCVVIAALVPALSHAEASEQAAANACASIVGDWSWGGVAHVVVDGSGSLFVRDNPTVSPTVAVGHWTCDATSRRYVMSWANGATDSLQLSADGRSLQGKNQLSVPVLATRIEKPPAASAPSPTPALPTTPRKPTDTAPVSPRSDTPRTAPQPGPSPRLAQGWCVIDRNNYQQAIAFLNSMVSRNPQDAEALYYRGRCWHYAKQYQRAVQDLNASLQLDPHNSYAYLYRGRARNAGRATRVMTATKYDVEADYTRAIQTNAENGDTYFARAVLYAQDFPTRGLEAYNDVSRAIWQKLNFPEAFVLRAEILLDYNRAPAALKGLDIARQLEPTYPNLDCRYGLAYWISGQRQVGDQWLNRCYAKDPAARPVYEQEKQVRLAIAQENARREAALSSDRKLPDVGKMIQNSEWTRRAVEAEGRGDYNQARLYRD